MQFCISPLHFWPCTFSFTGILLCLLCKLAARKITCFWHLHGTWVLWENFGCPPTTYLGSNSRPRTNCAITCRRYSILIWCPQLPSPICVFCFFFTCSAAAGWRISNETSRYLSWVFGLALLFSFQASFSPSLSCAHEAPTNSRLYALSFLLPFCLSLSLCKSAV